MKYRYVSMTSIHDASDVDRFLPRAVGAGAMSGLMIVGCGGDPCDAGAIDPIADASDANNKPSSVFDTIASNSG